MRSQRVVIVLLSICLVFAWSHHDARVAKQKMPKEVVSLQKQVTKGLGYVKKLSMQHHIELLSNYLKNVAE